MTGPVAALSLAGAFLPLVTACGHPEARLSLTPRLESGKGLIVWTAHAYARPARDVVVHGMVRATSTQAYVPGQLQVVLGFRDGSAPMTRDTRWRALSPRGSRVGAYEARFAVPDTLSVSQITVSYRPTGDDADSAGTSS